MVRGVIFIVSNKALSRLLEYSETYPAEAAKISWRLALVNKVMVGANAKVKTSTIPRLTALEVMVSVTVHL